MDLSILNVFVDVVKRGSFSAVARERKVPPSSVSRAVGALELELGVRLFQRNTRKIAVTEAGHIFFEQVRPLVDGLERARNTALEYGGNTKGVLRVTAPVTFGQMALVPVLPEFRSMYPDLSIDLRLEDSVVDILSERIDVAVRLGQLPSSEFVAIKLCSMGYVVCASPDYFSRYPEPHEPSELSAYECLLLALPAFSTTWQFRCRDGTMLSVPVRGRLRTTNVLALLQCCLAGMGLALLPRWAAASCLADGRLLDVFPDHRVAGDEFDRAAWLIYPSREYLPSKVSMFVNFVRKKFTAGIFPREYCPIDLVTSSDLASVAPRLSTGGRSDRVVMTTR